jgi:LysM repeat protein
MPILRLLLIILIAVLPAASLPAQTPEPVCGDLVARAVETVGTACEGLARNQACYGNQLIDVEFMPDQAPTFVASGDVIDLAALRRISATPFDGTADQWGIAVLKAQANLPDALPGQNVTFLLFGAASLDSPTADMRAVTVETSITEEVVCEEAPTGVLIQSPRGSQVEMTINGAGVTLGSTVFITAVADELLTLVTLDGAAVVTALDQVRVVLEGYQITIPVDDEAQVNGLPSRATPFDPTLVEYLPLSLLDEAISAPEATAEPTISTPAPSATACARRADWTARYIVQAGDTLSNIASRARLNVLALQLANCIADPNIIRAGEVLNVPFAIPTLPPPITPTITLTPPPVVTFYADRTTVNAGECATLYWTIGGEMVEAYIGEGTVESSGSMPVCPYGTETYTLWVIRPNDTSESYDVTITVTDICGDYICGWTEDTETCQIDCPAAAN